MLETIFLLTLYALIPLILLLRQFGGKFTSIIFFVLVSFYNLVPFPKDSHNSNLVVGTSSQSFSSIQIIRCGHSAPVGSLNIFEKIALFFNRKGQCPAPVPKFPIFQPQIEPSSNSKPDIAIPDTSGFTPSIGNNSGDNGNGNNNDGSLEIGTTEWQKWVCPDPDAVISYPDIWNNLSEEEEEICLDEDEIDQEIDPLELEAEERSRRRLLSVQPTPTGKLDARNLEKFDFTTQKLQPMVFPSREGIRLAMDHRSLRKAVYSHPKELGLTDLGSRIECPIQTDPNKFQRMDCWAVTNQNIREAVVKIFEFTTFDNPRIITVEKYPSTSANQKATYFIDVVTGNAVYFRVGGKQDGKLWSLENFDRNEILKIMTDPSIKQITDISDYNF